MRADDHVQIAETRTLARLCTKAAGRISEAKGDINAAGLVLFASAKILSRICKWKQDSDGNWETQCGELFVFETGGPKENQFVWCCNCRGLIK